MIKESEKVIIAMSGGVDSSVAAALLKKQGYFVIGVFMKFWKDGASSENRCCSAESEKLARLAAKKINIPFYVINVEKEFKKKVVDYFLKEYKAGRTPNPCVVCNKKIKFGLLLGKALKLGADYIATGHYVKISNFKLLKAKDKNKDQSYFLWQLNQKQLKHILFPIGDYTKAEVRKLAKKFKLPFDDIKESQEICFILKDVNDFLGKYIKNKPGEIVGKNALKNGLNGLKPGFNRIGKHKGLHFYTIGQRKGIDIFPSKKTSKEKPYYVVGKDINKNALIVSQNKKNLMKKELVAKNVNWISGIKPKLPLKIKAKIRYRSELVPAVVYNIQDTLYNIHFNKAQRAITPGQSVVLYRGSELLAGGIIDKVYRSN